MPLAKPLAEAWIYIRKHRGITSSELADICKVSVPLMGNRLLTLMSLGLIERERASSPSGGVEYAYRVKE